MVKMSLGKKIIFHKKMGPKKGCDLGKKCCFKVRMGAWVKLTRGWAWGEYIPKGNDFTLGRR
jgi:hypothetical protein